jgi:hypothetical protein
LANNELIATAAPTLEALLSVLYEESSTRLPFPDEKSVYEEFRAISPNGDLHHKLTDYIQKQLQSLEETKFTNGDIRVLQRSLFFERKLGLRHDELDKVLGVVTACLPSGISIKPCSDPVWTRIVDVVRGLLRTGYSTHELPSDITVAKAAAALARQGFKIEVASGELVLMPDELKRATKLVQKCLDELGFLTSSDMIFGFMTKLGMFQGGNIYQRTYIVMRNESRLSR